MSVGPNVVICSPNVIICPAQLHVLPLQVNMVSPTIYHLNKIWYLQWVNYTSLVLCLAIHRTLLYLLHYYIQS